MRTRRVAIAAVTAWLAWTVTPAGMAAADGTTTDPAPTNVTVAWATSAHKSILITWDETGDVENVVTLQDRSGTVDIYGPQDVPAGQPNREVLPADAGGTMRAAVVIGKPGSTPLSDPGYSVYFDTSAPPKPTLTSVVPRADGTVTITWTKNTVPDTTPGDPLDLPEAPVGYTVYTNSYPNNFDDLVPVGPTTTSTSEVLPHVASPYFVWIQTTSNEWGYSSSSDITVGTTKVTIARSAGATELTGIVSAVELACDQVTCDLAPWPSPGRTVSLEAHSGSGWSTVDSAKTSSTGRYTFHVRPSETTAYRVVVAPMEWHGNANETLAGFAMTSGTVSVTGTAPAGGTQPIGDGATPTSTPDTGLPTPTDSAVEPTSEAGVPSTPESAGASSTAMVRAASSTSAGHLWWIAVLVVLAIGGTGFWWFAKRRQRLE